MAVPSLSSQVVPRLPCALVLEAHTDVSLAPLTTLRLGGSARRLVTATSEDELIDVVREVDADGEPLLVLAGGSNVVISDDGWDGTVVRVATGGVAIQPSPAGNAIVRIAAGEGWDQLAERLVDEGLTGAECLAGIPGSAGATPIQNVGAYGQEIGSSLVSVRVLDRLSGAVSQMPAADCGLRYRSSVFKRSDRYLVLSVELELQRSALSQPIAYAELARRLGVEVGARVPLTAAREAVLDLRRGKAMVLDPADRDTWSAGSFFTNPVLTPEAFAELRRRAAELLGAGHEPPCFPAAGGSVKTSAAWLIERCGFHKGDRRGGVAISSRHALALTNCGDGTAAELIGFAREIAVKVHESLGVSLRPEPVLVGLVWAP